MKRLPILLLAGMFLAAPASQLSARVPSACACAEASLSDAVVSRVLHLAAPAFGMTDAQLTALYDAGQVLIEDLGPIKDGHRYGVTYGTEWFPIDDIYM